MKNVLLRSSAGIALTAAMLVTMAGSAVAESVCANSLELSTQYPVMVIKSGDHLTFDHSVHR